MTTDVRSEAARLAALWMAQQAEYPRTSEGEHAAAAVRCCAKELEALLASLGQGEQPEEQKEDQVSRGRTGS